MLRLREVNLVVVCSRETLPETRSTAGLVARAHPARVILMVVDPSEDGERASESPPTPLDSPSGTITTACLIDPSSGQQVCSEEVVIRGAPGEEEALRAAALQMLVPDVPVLGWWTEECAGHPSGLRWLTEVADQTVVDLRRSRQPLTGLETLSELSSAGGTRLQELEWLRSAHWRVLTAELFEQREKQALVPLLTHLEVDHSDSPLQALLYGAWFASRLGLHPRAGGWWVEGGSLCAGFAKDFIVRLAPVAGSGYQERGLTGIRIRSRSMAGGPPEEHVQAVDLRRGPYDCRCSALVGPEEDELLVKSLHSGEQEDSEYLSRVIDTPLHDRVLQETLLLAGQMVRERGFEFDVLSERAGEDPR